LEKKEEEEGMALPRNAEWETWSKTFSITFNDACLLGHNFLARSTSHLVTAASDVMVWAQAYSCRAVEFALVVLRRVITKIKNNNNNENFSKLW